MKLHVNIRPPNLMALLGIQVLQKCLEFCPEKGDWETINELAAADCQFQPRFIER